MEATHRVAFFMCLVYTVNKNTIDCEIAKRLFCNV